LCSIARALRDRSTRRPPMGLAARTLHEAARDKIVALSERLTNLNDKKRKGTSRSPAAGAMSPS